MDRSRSNINNWKDKGVGQFPIVAQYAPFCSQFGKVAPNSTESTSGTYNVDKVEHFADVVPGGVGVVPVEGVDDVVDEAGRPGALLVAGEDRRSAEPLGQVPDLALLPVLPDPVGHVEEKTLKNRKRKMDIGLGKSRDYGCATERAFQLLPQLLQTCK